MNQNESRERKKHISEFTLTIVIDRFLLGQRQWLSGFYKRANKNSESNKWTFNNKKQNTNEKIKHTNGINPMQRIYFEISLTVN